MATMRSLITGSLRLINAVQANEVPTSQDMDISLSAMNGLIDSMSNDLLNIFTFTPYRFLFTPGQKEYKLGPALDVNGVATNADWVTPRPMRIEQAKVLLYPTVTTLCSGGTCGLVSSVETANTVDLWHFDEGVGATSTTPTLNPEGNGPFDLSTGTMSLQPGSCETGLYTFTTGDGTELTLAQGASQLGAITLPDGCTIEFSLVNDGTSNPSVMDFAELFRNDGVVYSGGEGLTTMRGFKVGQELYFTRGSDLNNPIVVVPLPIGTSVAICIEWTPDWRLNIYANGIRVYAADLINDWGIYSPNYVDSSFSLFSLAAAPDVQTRLVIDEFRRTSGVLYDSATYQYSTGGTQTCVTTVGTTEQTIFMPLPLISDERYADIVMRDLQSSWPTKMYDNGGFPVRTMRVWPVPAEQYAVELWLWDPLAIYDTLDDELNLPPGYERYLRFKLAVEIAPEFGKEVSNTVKMALNEAESAVKRMNQQTPVAYGSRSGNHLNIPRNLGRRS